jgi:hypothetical protein
MALTYDKIASTTLGTAAASITFSSIAASWTDLRLVLVAKTTADGATTALSFNGVPSGTLYAWNTLTGNGSSASSSRNSSQDGLYPYSASTLASTPDFYTFDIFSYTSAINKTVLMTASQDYNGSGTVANKVGIWRSTAAITSCVLTNVGSTYASGTTATLYGILKA